MFVVTPAISNPERADPQPRQGRFAGLGMCDHLRKHRIVISGNGVVRAEARIECASLRPPPERASGNLADGRRNPAAASSA